MDVWRFLAKEEHLTQIDGLYRKGQFVMHGWKHGLAWFEDAQREKTGHTSTDFLCLLLPSSHILSSSDLVKSVVH